MRERSICHGARILGITDSVVVLVSKSPHRGCILPKEAEEFVDAFQVIWVMQISSGCIRLWNLSWPIAESCSIADLVKIFTKELPTYPSGIMVKLNTGEVGIVSNANCGYFSRPKVRLCYDREMRDLDKTYDITWPTQSTREN